MSLLRFYSLDAQESLEEAGFDSVVLDEQVVDEMEVGTLQNNNVELNDFADWSCNEIFAHDCLPTTSRAIDLSDDIFDTRMVDAVDNVVDLNVTMLNKKESFKCSVFDADISGRKYPILNRSNRKKATIVQCEYCGIIIKHPSKIQAHMRTHTGEKPFECFICGMRFTQRTPMRMHVRRHLNETPFICSFGCGKSFVSNAIKNAHEVKAHFKEQRRSSTKSLPKSLKRRALVVPHRLPAARNHVDTSTVQRPINGSLQGIITAAANEKLDEVINAVAAGVSLDPPKKVRRRTAIIAECGECGLIIKHPSKIKAHMRIHTGERPFECQFCNMRFATANPLRVHLRRVHTGEKPYECTWDCGRRFVSISARNEHERVVHAGLKRYQCTIDNCRRLFTRRHYLLLHQAKDHDVKNDLTTVSKKSPTFGRRKQISDTKAVCFGFSLPSAASDSSRFDSNSDHEYVDVEEPVDFKEINNRKLTGVVTRVDNGKASVWIPEKKSEATLSIKGILFEVTCGNWLEISLLVGDRILECKQIRSLLEDDTIPIVKDDILVQF